MLKKSFVILIKLNIFFPFKKKLHHLILNHAKFKLSHLEEDNTRSWMLEGYSSFSNTGMHGTVYTVYTCNEHGTVQFIQSILVMTNAQYSLYSLNL